MTIGKIQDGLPQGAKPKKEKAPTGKKINLRVSNPNHVRLGLMQYKSQLWPTRKGLTILHKGIVKADGVPEPECYKEFEFEIAAAEQDDLGIIERKWKATIDALRAEYAMDGVFVTMDIKIPMYVVKKMQGKMPKNIKDAVTENSAPPTTDATDGPLII